MKIKGKIFLITLFCLIPHLLFAQQYKDWRKCPKFRWEKNWEEWAKITGNEEWALWAKELQKPKALSLGKAWADYLGYDSVSLVNRSQLAPDIVPDLVINENNYQNYPGLKKLLRPSLYKRLRRGEYAQIPELRIAPTMHRYHSRGRLEATKRYEGTCKLIVDGQQLLNWKAGIPFPHPRNAAEVAHSFDRIGSGSDTTSFNPIDFLMWERKGKFERIIKSQLQWYISKGRYDLPPIPNAPDAHEILEKGSLVIVYPYDLKGYAGVRQRFVDPEKEDSFEFYLPFLRRVRRLSGADTQDPIIGTDIAWEDWKGWWQKLSPKMWPMEYKMVDSQAECLLPVQWLTTYTLKGDKVLCYWERRPSWVIDAICKTKLYFYSKRRVWIDKELFTDNMDEKYDIRGNLWRDWFEIKMWDPENGYTAWWGVDVADYPNRHRTIAKMDCIANDPKITDEYFSLGWLRKMAH